MPRSAPSFFGAASAGATSKFHPTSAMARTAAAYLCAALPAIMAACGSGGGYASGAAVDNATISIADIDFAIADWRYELVSDPNKGSLSMVASNGNTCALIADPNAPNTRLVYVNAFTYTDPDNGYTTAPTVPGIFPIETDAALGASGSVYFRATGPSGEPLLLTDQTVNPTTPFAGSGNVTLNSYAVGTADPVGASAFGTVNGTNFWYSYSATTCP